MTGRDAQPAASPTPAPMRVSLGALGVRGDRRQLVLTGSVPSVIASARKRRFQINYLSSMTNVRIVDGPKVFEYNTSIDFEVMLAVFSPFYDDTGWYRDVPQGFHSETPEPVDEPVRER